MNHLEKFKFLNFLINIIGMYLIRIVFFIPIKVIKLMLNIFILFFDLYLDMYSLVYFYQFI